MSSPESYIERALRLMEDVRSLTNPAEQRESFALALQYLRLAEMAAKNERNDIVYEPPPVRASEPQQVGQQQQQIQPPAATDE